MDRFGTLLLLVLLQFLYSCDTANTNCCNGKNSEIETEGCNNDCNSDCDCSAESCQSCQGHDKCCNYCCNNNCNCQSVSCTSCSSSNDCCGSCCKNKCRGSGCSSRSCKQCNCESCSSRQVQTNSCCNSCCKDKIEKQEWQPSNVSQITTLPNITIIINHAPIYVNNTPVINNEQRCGNASVLTNGTHIVYVYPQNSSCNNRTCCSRMVRPRCQMVPPPMPPMPPMPPVCPPPVYVSDCSPRCMHAPPPPPPPMPPQPHPCQYYQSWPYVHCPQTGCYGLSCAPPQMPMTMSLSMPMPMPMPVMQPAPMYSGCIQMESWPFIRCIPGMTGDSMISYGPPSTQLIGAGGESPSMPFTSQTYTSSGYAPGVVPVYSPGVHQN